tara:strand:- start:14674 stop:14817 length:144 start_codon:yes stop_codon:yes gene_type:complete
MDKVAQEAITKSVVLMGKKQHNCCRLFRYHGQSYPQVYLKMKLMIEE